MWILSLLSLADQATSSQADIEAEDEEIANIQEEIEWLHDDLELDSHSPRAPSATPSLPAHLQHMAERPWVAAMQLRWIRDNMIEERTEKRE